MVGTQNMGHLAVMALQVQATSRASSLSPDWARTLRSVWDILKSISSKVNVPSLAI